jgi:hypothetical protein
LKKLEEDHSRRNHPSLPPSQTGGFLRSLRIVEDLITAALRLDSRIVV